MLSVLQYLRGKLSAHQRGKLLRRLGQVSVSRKDLLVATIVPGPHVNLGRCQLIIRGNSLVRGSIHFDRAESGVEIGANTAIGVGTQLVVSERIVIGANVLISYNCLIMDHDGHSLDLTRRQRDLDDLLSGRPKDWQHVERRVVTIGDGAWIGAGSTILKGVKIGERAIVGARSVVIKDVPADTIVAGNPARVIAKVPPAFKEANA